MEEIEAKTGARAEEEDTTGGDKTADETVVEEIRKVTERRCLRQERRRADLDIGDKERGKRHSSDNAPKRLKTGSRERENDKADTLPEDDEGGREAEDEKTEEDETEEETRDEEVET